MKDFPQPVPGSSYKFTVNSADEAAAIIRERLGARARVLSVRTVEASGISRLWAPPKLEVVAHIDGPAEADVEEAFAPASAVLSSSAAAPALAAFPRQATAVMPTLPALLRRAGLSDVALGRLQADPGWPALLEQPLHRALVQVAATLQGSRPAAGATARPLTRAAFLGTAGSGRTTALCKWLGIEVFRRFRAGHVVTAEFDRPNPTGSLAVFCEALGVPVARFPASTQPAVEGGFVYFDLPGISLRDSADNRAVADFLNREQIEQRVLVLNAAYDHATLRTAYAAGRALGATHLVLSHLDEVPQWGRLWEYVFDGGLEPLFLAQGPSLTGDCEEDARGALVRRILAAGTEAAGQDPGETTAGRPAAAHSS